MFIVTVDETKYNNMIHDLLKLSIIMVELQRSGDMKSLNSGLRILCEVRERMLEIIENSS